MRTPPLSVVVAAFLLAACGSSAAEDDARDATSAPVDDISDGLVITRDVAVADMTTADVFAPHDADALPVVVMFHGTEGLRSNMEPLAADVARSGAVVVVPSWPVVTQRPPVDTTEDVYYEQTATAVCAVRFARVTAPEYGGDATDLTVVGHSGGAPVGARVSVVEEPPWPGIDCYPDVSSRVDRFIGTGGDFTNEYQFGTWIPDVYRPYDVFELDATNRDLQAVLVHGGADNNVWVGNSTSFDQHLSAVGVASDMVYLDTAHGELIDPSKSAGRFVADQIDAVIHEQPSVLEQTGSAATLTFDGDGCRFDGATTVALGQPFRLRLDNGSDVPVWFSMVGFEPGVTDTEMTAVLAAGPLPLDEPPQEPTAANFVSVEPGSDGEMTWVFLHDSLRWVSYCMPHAESAHPGAGMMYPASEVVPMS